jgi:hypothetical protein
MIEVERYHGDARTLPGVVTWMASRAPNLNRSTITVIDRVVARLAAGALFVLCFASRSAAQMQVEIGATVGYYSPMGSFQTEQAHSIDLPSSPGSLSGTAIGGDFRLWVVPRVALELTGSTTASAVGGGATPEGDRPSIPARVNVGTAQLLLRVTGDADRPRVWIGAGVAAVRHGGAAYGVFGKPVNYGGIVGLGSAFRIVGGLNANIGLSAMIYNIDFRSSSIFEGLNERGTQVDMMLRTGVSYRWP